jgi:hypothetical protein
MEGGCTGIGKKKKKKGLTVSTTQLIIFQTFKYDNISQNYQKLLMSHNDENIFNNLFFFKKLELKLKKKKKVKKGSGLK